MSVTESILRRQLDGGVFDKEERMVYGIAQRAVDPAHGYESLSASQKRVLEPFLTQPCSGRTDAGGHYNECQQVLTGTELLEAYDQSDDIESPECANCRSEAEAEQHTWDNGYVDKEGD